ADPRGRAPDGRREQVGRVTGLRVGVVGTGARASLAAHLAPAGATVVAAADPAPAAPERLAAVLGHPVPVHPGLDDLLAAERLDAAMVLTPDDTHEEIAVTLLE